MHEGKQKCFIFYLPSRTTKKKMIRGNFVIFSNAKTISVKKNIIFKFKQNIFLASSMKMFCLIETFGFEILIPRKTCRRMHAQGQENSEYIKVF